MIRLAPCELADHLKGSDENIYSYTIITTDANKQLKFLHDRMPVILENGSEKLRTWLDPARSQWTKELQDLLKPFTGVLKCYAVSKDVGKVGNNSPDYIVPVASSENKNNIANFFANTKTPEKQQDTKTFKGSSDAKVEIELMHNNDDRLTSDPPRSEDNAPMPQPLSSPKSSIKRSHNELETEEDHHEEDHGIKTESQPSRVASPIKKKLRSSTSNGTIPGKSPLKAPGGNQRITSFFNK